MRISIKLIFLLLSDSLACFSRSGKSTSFKVTSKTDPNNQQTQSIVDQCTLESGHLAKSIEGRKEDELPGYSQDEKSFLEIVISGRKQQPSTVVHLKDDLIPQKPDPIYYNNTIPIKCAISDLIKRSEKLFPADRRHVHNMLVLNGSYGNVFEPRHFPDNGFLTVIHVAYNNHWGVKTVPDDWWYTIIRTVAIAIDNNSKKNEVRNYFVNHKGKKRLKVDVDRINGIDYNLFFRKMTDLVQSNIKVPEYVETIRSDFNTSTSVHRISSEITIMSSMQEYFEYVMGFTCGIPFFELQGTEEDWNRLKQKFQKLKNMLQPIENDIDLADWWPKVETILDKLVESYRGNTDTSWWTNIFRWTEDKSFGSGGPEYEFDGWFLKDLLNIKGSFIKSLGQVPSGLVSVPLIFSDNGIEIKGALSSGIAGLKLDQSRNVPVVEATHGWAIFAERNINI